MSPKELQAKIRQLLAERKTREMQQLVQKMAAGAGAGSSWDLWAECLKKMEAEGYPTLITIHIQP